MSKKTHKQIVNRLKDIHDEMERLAGKDDITPEDETYWAELRVEFDELDGDRKQLERDADLVHVRELATSSRNIERGSGDLDRDIIGEPDSIEDGKFRNPWDLSGMRMNVPIAVRGQELRARALSAIEQMPGMNDKRREGATKIIERWDNTRGDIAHLALATSSPEYLRAFNKAARGQQNMMATEEVAAVERAMSLTDSQGGFLVPFQLDPTVIITSDGSLNEIRRVARQVVATGDVWNGVSAGETSWSWDAEATEASDDASTFVQPQVTVHKAVGFVPISLEALQDEQNVAAEVSRLLSSGKDTLEAEAFATGSGSGEPFGIVTALDANTNSEVASATNDEFNLVDLYTLDESLPARHRPRASWLAHRAIYNDIRQFDTSGGAALWERLGADVPPLLLGRRAYESEDMDSDPTTSAVNSVLIYGDFQHYVVADRIGVTVEFIPHLFEANNRPTGQRGWFAYYRTGADSVHDTAFRMLQT